MQVSGVPLSSHGRTVSLFQAGGDGRGERRGRKGGDILEAARLDGRALRAPPRHSVFLWVGVSDARHGASHCDLTQSPHRTLHRHHGLGSSQPTVSGSEVRHFQTQLTKPPSWPQTHPGTRGANGKAAGSQGGKALSPGSLSEAGFTTGSNPSGLRTSQMQMSTVQSRWD